jgi:hypothetical protein
MIECKAELEQEATFKDSRWNCRISDSAKENHISLCKFCHDRVRKYFTGAMPVTSAEVVMSLIESDAVLCSNSIKDLEALPYNFSTDSIAWNDCKVD